MTILEKLRAPLGHLLLDVIDELGNEDSWTKRICYRSELMLNSPIKANRKQCVTERSRWTPFSDILEQVPGRRHGLLEIEAESCAEGCDSVAIVKEPSTADYEDLPLVTLDVRSLRYVQHAWRNITPPSSLDLEWEHEGVIGNIPAVCHQRLLSTTEEFSTGSAAEGSPAESLEWDSCEGALDTDTEQLLCEIEQLTARALRETGGDWANR